MLSPDQVEYLRRFYGRLSVGEIADALGVDYRYVTWKARMLGLSSPRNGWSNLVRDNEFMERMRGEGL